MGLSISGYEPQVSKSTKTVDPTTTICGAVFYTDGGATNVIANVGGNGGWGVHGYLYRDLAEKEKKIHSAQDCYVTADGYVPKVLITEPTAKNTVAPIQYYDAFGSYARPVTNNLAELTATTKALEYIKKSEFNCLKITILTDSEYVCKGLNNWVDGWKKNNWLRGDGNAPANVDAWKKLSSLRDELVANGCVVDVQWVRGHSGDLGNEASDVLATFGTVASARGREVNHEKEYDIDYWKSTVTKHPMIANRRMYFNTHADFNIPGEYYLGEHGRDDDLLGMRMPDGAYSVIRLTEPDRMLEFIRNYQIEIAGGVDSIIMARLDKLYSPMVYRLVTEYGSLPLEREHPNKLSLNFIDDEPVTKELRPPRLAMRAVDAVCELIERLDHHLKGCAGVKFTSTTVTDITQVIYDLGGSEDKRTWEIKKTFSSGVMSFKPNIKYMSPVNGVKETPITITFGLDLPDRNTLKRLEDKKPKVSVVTWKDSDTAMRFATIIECTDGVGIWCGYYSNLLFVEI